MNNKLKLKHLAPYLPYGVHLMNEYGNWHHKTTDTYWNIKDILNYKPILRPLSDLTKVNGFSLSDMISHDYHNPFWLPENFEVKYLMHLDFEKLVSWHFDVFGLIEKGLAIDINTIKDAE